MTDGGGRIAVILDTDIGSDIDDTWALGMMLKCPELDVRLVVSDTGPTAQRAKIIAKMLEVAGRSDVPVGVGIDQGGRDGPQAPWVADYDLAGYAGTVHEDGVEAMVRAIMDSPQPPTLICIGPMPNIAAALDREPGIAGRARFVGMHGSIRRGYAGGAAPSAEYNVKADAASCRRVFQAPWREMVITPLDTCGLVRLGGRRYERLKRSAEPVMQAVLENYRIWAQNNPRCDPEAQSSVLFDTVAVYLAFATRHLVMERMGVAVTDDGFTVEDPAAREMDVAIEWEDLDAYEELLTQRLLGPVVR